MLTLEIRGADIFENTHECRFYRPYVLRGITCFRLIFKFSEKFNQLSQKILYLRPTLAVKDVEESVKMRSFR